MRRALALSMLAIAVAAAMGAVSSMQAVAGGNGGTGCSSGFGGTVTREQHRSLPRVVAGVEAGAYDEAFVDDVFTAVDRNGNGYICYKDPPGSNKAAPASGWQYLYNVVDDQSAAS